MIRRVLGFFALLPVVAAAGCDRPASVPRNVVLVFVDTLRADHLGAYGYPRDTSPALDRFAQEAVVFENAFAQSSWTLPSFMSLFTSQYLAGLDFGGEHPRLPASLPVLTEYFREAGWRTGGFVDVPYLHAEYGFDRGFDRFDEEDGAGTAELAARALAWIREEPERPHLLFLHTYDVHGPYGAPEPYGSRFLTPEALRPAPPGAVEQALQSHVFGKIPAYQFEHGHWNLDYYVARYDGAIAGMDAELETFFEGLRAAGVWDDTLVLVSSDHGESLTENGYYLDHGILTDPVIRVPLIVKFPRRRHAGRRVETPVQLVDVMPTLLELLDAAPRAPLRGRSLVRAMDEAPADPRVFAFDGIMDQWSVRTREWKLVRKVPGSREDQVWRTCPESDPEDRDAVVEELFDLTRDPGENRSVASRSPDRRAFFVGELDRLLEEERVLTERLRLVQEEAEVDEATKERLRALGYVAP